MDDYPKIVPCDRGYIVHLSKKVRLPGYYTDHRQAEQAIRIYHGRIREAVAARKAQKESN